MKAALTAAFKPIRFSSLGLSCSQGYKFSGSLASRCEHEASCTILYYFSTSYWYIHGSPTLCASHITQLPLNWRWNRGEQETEGKAYLNSYKPSYTCCIWWSIYLSKSPANVFLSIFLMSFCPLQAFSFISRLILCSVIKQKYIKDHSNPWSLHFSWSFESKQLTLVISE